MTVSREISRVAFWLVLLTEHNRFFAFSLFSSLRGLLLPGCREILPVLRSLQQTIKVSMLPSFQPLSGNLLDSLHVYHTRLTDGDF